MMALRLHTTILLSFLLFSLAVLGQDIYDDEYDDNYEDATDDYETVQPTNPPVVLTPAPTKPTRAPKPNLQLCARDKSLDGCPDTWSEAAGRLHLLIRKVQIGNVAVRADYARIVNDLRRLYKMYNALKESARFTSERLFSPSSLPIEDPSHAILPVPPENQFGGTYDDCQAAFRSGNSKTGVYLIRPRDSPYDMRAYCDNGWTVIQRRFDGSVDFYRPWSKYLAGFGNYGSEFWLGLENIYQLTRQEEYTIRFDMQGFSGKWYFSAYPSFSIGDETTYYQLSVGNMTVGSIDDAFTDGNGFGFTTMDKDNDGWFETNCATHYFGAWWSSNCGSDLNRRLCKTSGPGCMEWAGIQMEKSLIRIKPTASIQADDLLPGA